MALFNSAQDITRVGLKEGTRYRAIVTDNKDPKQLGRIKFKIPNFFEFPLELSPWAIPDENGVDGATATSGSLNIPRIDSWIDIMFRGASQYHPAYLPTTIFKSVQLDRSQVNYPDRIIRQLGNGAYFIIDEYNGLIEFFNPGDLQMVINGSASLTVKGTLVASVTGNATVESSEGDVSVISDAGNVVVNSKAGTTSVLADSDVSVLSTNGKVILQGPSGAGDLAGVVTSSCICAFSGQPHSDYSQEVFATTGGK